MAGEDRAEDGDADGAAEGAEEGDGGAGRADVPQGDGVLDHEHAAEVEPDGDRLVDVGGDEFGCAATLLSGLDRYVG